MTAEELDELCRHAAQHGEVVLYVPPGEQEFYAVELIPNECLVDGEIILYELEVDNERG